METTPYLLADQETVNVLDSRQVSRIPATKVRDDMVIADEATGLPLYAIDHKVRATAGSGCVEFLVEDLTGQHGNQRWVRMGFHRNTTVPVWAR